MSILETGINMGLDKLGLQMAKEQANSVPTPEQFNLPDSPLGMPSQPAPIGTLPMPSMFVDVTLPDGRVVKAVNKNGQLLYQGQVIGNYDASTGKANVTAPPATAPEKTGPSTLERIGAYGRPGQQSGAILWGPQYMFQDKLPGGEPMSFTPKGQAVAEQMAEKVRPLEEGNVNPLEILKAMWGIGEVFQPWGKGGQTYEEEIPLGARIATEAAIEAPMYIGGGKALGAIPRLARLPAGVRTALGIEKARPSAAAMGKFGATAKSLLGKGKVTPAVKAVTPQATRALTTPDDIAKMAKNRMVMSVTEPDSGVVSKYFGTADGVKVIGDDGTVYSLNRAWRKVTPKEFALNPPPTNWPGKRTSLEEAMAAGEKALKNRPQATKLTQAVTKLVDEAITPDMPAPRQTMLTKLKSVISTHRETRGAIRGSVKAEQAERFGQLEATKTAPGWVEVGATKGALKGELPRAVPILKENMKFTDDEAREMLKMLQERGASGLEITKIRDSLIKMGQVSADASENVIRDVLQPSEWKLINRFLFPSKSAKGLRNAIEVLNMPRAFMASGDMSYTFRQLLFELPQQGIRHPLRTTREIFNQFKVLVYKNGDDLARQLHDDMLKDTQFIDDAARMQVQITETTRKGTPWQLREEAFGSYLANKIPWVRRSNNAAATIANRIRYWAVKDSAARLRRIASQPKGKVTQADWDAMGRLINTGTGRGNISWITKIAGEKGAGIINAILFSPRLLAAHFQFPYYSLKTMVQNPVLRVEIARRWGTTLGMGISTLALLKAMGIATVELDPRSANFGKAKIRNTRIDLWGGKSQTLRFVVQMALAQKKLQSGETIETVRWNILMNYLQSKEAPGFAIIPELLGRPDYYDDDNQWIENEIGRETYEHIAPLVLQDIVDVLVKEGTIGDAIGSEALGAGIVGGAAFMGVGAQTYEGASKTTGAGKIDLGLGSGSKASTTKKKKLDLGLGR